MLRFDAASAMRVLLFGLLVAGEKVMRAIKDLLAGVLLFLLMVIVCAQFVHELDRQAIEAQQRSVVHELNRQAIEAQQGSVVYSVHMVQR